MISRREVLLACRTHGSKRYLSTPDYHSLSQEGKIEAILWMVWPRMLKREVILNILRRLEGIAIGESPKAFTTLVRAERIVRLYPVSSKISCYRFKPKE